MSASGKQCKFNRNQIEDKMCLFGSNIHVSLRSMFFLRRWRYKKLRNLLGNPCSIQLRTNLRPCTSRNWHYHACSTFPILLFLKNVFSLFYSAKLCVIVFKYLGLGKQEQGRERRKERGRPLWHALSLPPPLLLSRYVKHPAQPNILCTCCPVPHPVFFPFWLVAKIHDQHSGPPFPYKIRRRISWERKKEGKGKYVAFSLNSNKIQLFPLLFLEKKFFLNLSFN